MFATDHVELTSAMLKDWGIPQTQITSIAAQNDEIKFELLNNSRTKRLVRHLEFANQIALLCQTDNPQLKSVLVDIQEHATRIRLSKKSLHDLIDGVVQQWQDCGKLLEIPSQELPSMGQMEKELVSSAPISSEPEANLSKLKILLIDDDLPILKRLSALLKSAGHSILVAEEGKYGLKLALEEKPHLIITDW